jgi:2'-hydroxyisoflavone reductase
MSSFSRRTFIASMTAAAAGAAFAAGSKKPQKLSILILDTLGPLGRYQARAALARGHSVTIYKRGERDHELPDTVEFLEGTRFGDYAALSGRRFDVIIDNGAASQPKWVAAVATHVAAKHYIFLSNETEEAEGAVAESFASRTIIRAAATAGTGDPTDRFTYWAVRVAAGGEVLAPGSPDSPAAFIDLRDLSEWMIRLAEQRTRGTFDAIAPLTMREFLEGLRTATKSDATFTWVPAEFVISHDVRLPVWTKHPFDPKSAMAAGLTYRPLSDTAATTLAWYRSFDLDRQAAMRAGITREQEQALLDAWSATKKEIR